MTVVIDGTLGVDTIQDNTVTSAKIVNGSVTYADLKVFTSSNQTITSAGLLTLAHGLGAVPKQFEFWLICLTAEAGYSVGDRVVANRSISDSATDSHIWQVYADITNIYVRFGANASPSLIGILHKTTGVGTAIANANWALVVEAIG